MKSAAFAFTTLFLVASIAAAQDGKSTGMPAELRKHIDEHVIGEWTYEGSWGDKKFTGEERISWTAGKTAVISEGYEEKASGAWIQRPRRNGDE